MYYHQQRVAIVLDRIKAQIEADDVDAAMYSERLDGMLDAMLGDDCFGTEGQTDPRGDQRNGEWSMECVEGIDEFAQDDEEDED